MELLGPETFLPALEGKRGQDVADILLKVINHPSIFVFGELFDLENVRELEQNEQLKPYFDLLSLFAYGTFADYQRDQSKLPQLSASQIRKLKMLTLIALSNKTKIITYATLQEQLGISTVRELEDMIIECTYSGLIKGRMDQQNQILQVQFAIGRDVRPEELPGMIDRLSGWLSSANELMSKIDQQIAFVDRTQQQKADHAKAFSERRDEMMARVAQDQEKLQMQSMAAFAGDPELGMMAAGMGDAGPGFLDMFQQRGRPRRSHR
eukprot:gnl/Trimastix_PCT/422.p1 GENE.gnl/Trimastix_PCT/422~~gnl/Trimastix_PCT/422.p1  ORF type:complete len:266 (-),score=71.97 gnl/Trimastix_PCT/422:218-1015(-)